MEFRQVRLKEGRPCTCWASVVCFTTFLQRHRCYEASAAFSNLVASHLIPGTNTLQTQFLEILVALGWHQDWDDSNVYPGWGMAGLPVGRAWELLKGGALQGLCPTRMVLSEGWKQRRCWCCFTFHLSSSAGGLSLSCNCSPSNHTKTAVDYESLVDSLCLLLTSTYSSN